MQSQIHYAVSGEQGHAIFKKWSKVELFIQQDPSAIVSRHQRYEDAERRLQSSQVEIRYSQRPLSIVNQTTCYLVYFQHGYGYWCPETESSIEVGTSKSASEEVIQGLRGLIEVLKMFSDDLMIVENQGLKNLFNSSTWEGYSKSPQGKLIKSALKLMEGRKIRFLEVVSRNHLKVLDTLHQSTSETIYE